MTLKSVFEVKPHGIFCDYSIYLWFVFPSSNGMNDSLNTLSFLRKCTQLWQHWLGSGLRFGQGFSYGKQVCGSWAPWVALQINSSKHMGLCFLVGGQCHPQSWKQSCSEAVFFPLRLTQERVVFSNPKRNEKESYINFFS